MTDFTNAAGTGYVDGDGFRGAPIPGVNPASAGNLTHKPASFPSGISGQPSIAPTLVVAAGASQGNATKLTGNGMYFASTTTSLEGLELPANVTGLGLWIFAPTAHGIKVYPPLHSTIDASASNVAISLAAAKSAFFVAEDSTHWRSLRSA